MNMKAFIRTNLMLMKCAALLVCHFMVSEAVLYYQSLGNYTPDIPDHFGFFFIVTPMLYAIFAAVFMMVKYAVFFPIKEYYKEQCERDH